jgi:hypothetical protein
VVHERRRQASSPLPRGREPTVCGRSSRGRRPAGAASRAVRARQVVEPEGRDRLPREGRKGPLLGLLAIHRAPGRRAGGGPHRRVLRGQRPVKTWPRQERGKKTDYSDFPPEKVAFFMRTPVWCRRRAQELGPAVQELVAILLSGPLESAVMPYHRAMSAVNQQGPVCRRPAQWEAHHRPRGRWWEYPV